LYHGAGEEKLLLRGRIAYDGSARAADFMAGFSRGWIHWGSALATWQSSAAYALAVMFVMTGSAHFTGMRHDLERMVPSAFPHPHWIIYATGALERLGAAGMLLPVRGLVGACLIVLLIAMFPANITAAREGLSLRGKPTTALWLRVPMQIFFIGLIWWARR
jgi:uncharacterized membrane protein